MLVNLLTCLTLLGTARAALDTSGFLDQIQNLANNILGAEKFQDYLDDEVVYASTFQTSGDALKELSEDLIFKISKRIEAVTTLRDTLQSEFESFGDSSTFGDCCDCCRNDGDQAAYLKFHSEQIDLNKMCHTGQGTRGPSTKTYPNQALLSTMKQNLEDNPNLKWQYFGGEDGVMSIYPGNKACDQKYDPRYRPWYSHTAFPTPKDVVVVIDRSGSMNEFHGNRMLISIAKEAATTVVDTLNADDRVGVVYFSSEAQTRSSSCHGTELAQATSENKGILNEYIASVSATGNTMYSKAFRKAFDLLHGSSVKPEFDSRERVKVILFLTDGRPTDNDYLDVISAQNARINNSVVILTFGFGPGIASDEQQTLEHIAQQINYDPSAGAVTSGEFVYVWNPDNLRHNMATFYDFFSSGSANTEVTVSVPYLDAFGLGLITSICLPVRVANSFQGVTCIDITLSDLFSDATFFSQNAESYAIVMDAQTRLIIHPLLPRPTDVFDHPVVLRMLDLEIQTEVQDIVNTYIKKGLAGSSTFASRRVLARGDSEYDGVNTVTISSVYSWKPLGLANLILCVVLGPSGHHTGISGDSSIYDFPYHRLDLTNPPDTCRYINRLAVTDTSTIKFAPFAFSSPDYYLETEETNEIIRLYEAYFAGQNEAPFQNGVKSSVSVSMAFDDTISKADDAWQSAVWRYLGLREGVFRLFPGAKLVKNYDHTVRPWYKRAMAQKTLITFSKPYIDAFGAGIVITLSKAIFESGGNTLVDITAGCVGMDFTLDLFNSLVSKNIPACQNDKCFVIDNGGFIIAHPDFQGTEDDDAHTIENLHITQKEGNVARVLFDNDIMSKDGCINYEVRQAQTFWRISRDSYSDANKFEMQQITGTNIYIVRVIDYFDTNGCGCAQKEGLTTIPKCGGSNSGCECPCYNRDEVNFDECTAKFNFDGEIGLYPPCTPPTPSVDLSSVEIEERKVIKSLTHCYPVEQVCPKRKQQLDCSATAGCIWCGNCEVRGDDEACKPWDHTAVAIAVPIVGVLLVIAGIVCCCNRKKICHRRHKTRSNPTAPAEGRDNITMRRPSASNPPPANYEAPNLQEYAAHDRSNVYATATDPQASDKVAPSARVIAEPPPTYAEALNC